MGNLGVDVTDQLHLSPSTITITSFLDASSGRPFQFYMWILALNICISGEPYVSCIIA
jgi:hypothetical protein